VTAAAALLYAALARGTIGFRLALIPGAPGGALTQGGQHRRRLPRRNRVFAGL